MKKIIILITVLFFFKTSFSQYPNGTQTIGNDSNVVQAKGGFKGRVINWTYTDTTAANLERIKGYPGAQIFTTSDSSIWFRSPNANKWISLINSNVNPSSDTLVWRIGGNFLEPLSSQLLATLGSRDSVGLYFMTDATRRLFLPANGINRSSSPANKYLMMDTTNLFMYYGDGGGTSSLSFTNGLTESGGTVKLGGTLIESTVVDGQSLYGIRFDDITAYDVVAKSNQATGTDSVAIFGGDGTAQSAMVLKDSLFIRPHLGRIYIDTLQATDTTQFIVGYRSNGQLVKRLKSSLTPTLQQVTDVDSITTNSIYVGGLGFTRNTDTVQASGYEAISTSAPNFIGQNLFVLSVAQQSRVRQTGNIQKIQFYTGSLDPALTAFYIDVWRYNGSTFDRVQHFNATSQIVGGQIETVFCTPSLAVLEGDYIGMSYTCSGVPTPFVTATNLGSLASYFTNADPGSTAVNWTAQSSTNFFVPIHIYMQAPHMVAIGNSIMSGVPYHNSYISPTISNSLSSSIPYKVEQSLNIVAQNMGLGGNTTTQMLARFHNDVVEGKPTVALIEGGVNDVYFGATTATVISNYKAMLDSCVANSIKPYVLLILPWTNGTNSQNMQVDTINYKIDSMITASYPTGRIIDCRPLVGEFRSGGTAGNYWDIQAAYDYDGVHFTVPGNTVIAAAIAEVDQSTAYKSNSIVHNGKTYLFPDSSGTLVTAENIVITAPGSSGDLLINDAGNIGTGGTGAMNYTTGSGLTIDNNVSIPGGVLSLFDGIPNNTQVNTQTWGNNYGEAAQHWYDNGATSRSGVGQAVGELQFFIPGIFKFSFNEGGTLQTPGTNVLATIDPANDVINLNLPTNVGTVATPSSTLKVFGSFAGAITTVTANTTASISHYTILSDATSGNITITLPAASTCAGRIYIVKKIDASGNSVTIDGDSAETIDGAATVSTTTQWVSFQIQSNGANWYKLN